MEKNSNTMQVLTNICYSSVLPKSWRKSYTVPRTRTNPLHWDLFWPFPNSCCLYLRTAGKTVFVKGDHQSWAGNEIADRPEDRKQSHPDECLQVSASHAVKQPPSWSVISNSSYVSGVYFYVSFSLCTQDWEPFPQLLNSVNWLMKTIAYCTLFSSGRQFCPISNQLLSLLFPHRAQRGRKEPEEKPEPLERL